MKKVSVIIPFYSGIDWLKEAVESALNQTYSNVEVIVVNDGSPENMCSFLDSYSKKIKYIYQTNQGAAAARNLGLKMSSGDYVAFLDSDDIWLQNKLEKQISFMQKIGAKWCHTNYFYWTPETDNLKIVDISKEYGDIYRKTFVSIRIATPCVVIAREVFEEHPEFEFPVNYRIGQDTKLWQVISKYYPIALINEPLTKVRLRSNNTYKQTIKVIQLKSNEFKLTYLDPDVPFFSKLRNFIFYLYGFIFKLPSSSKKNFIAKFFVAFPYFLGRVYVNLISLSNSKYKDFIS
jgi:glycosyltransferase involved in cell wall biosynthesis